MSINRPFGDLGHMPLESIDGSVYCLLVNINGTDKIPSFYKLELRGTMFKLSNPNTSLHYVDHLPMKTNGPG